ncbi:phage tail protein [Pseudogracilibacillus auburnensis]|uniref:phage tail protein n=1 Tax=Pseudogracilibacillus auburnensis TaxID=1494959 RepID=UPI001A96674B|nr:tape measure protein [Pseudogracilibacillus auburnensis]MBO1002670.1 tape measure protein [Pseudogracilibacillus auburnensis]
MDSYSIEMILKVSGATQFSSELKIAMNYVQGVKKSTEKANLTLGKLFSAVGGNKAVSQGFQLIKNSMDGAFSRIDTMERFEQVMTTMTGSSEKANAVMKSISDTFTGTSYGLEVATKATQDFVNSNMDVDKAAETVAAWGDAVSFYGDGSSETFASVSNALADMTSNGTVQMDAMNRLTEAGIPAMQIYADATNQSVEDVADAMEKGELDAESFTNVMNNALQNGTENFEGIAGAAKEGGASWGDIFNNMQDSVAVGVSNIIQAIDEMLTSNGLPDMRTMIAEFGSKFEEVLSKVAEFIPIIAEKIKSISDVLEPWLPLISAVTLGIGTVITAIAGFNTVNGFINILNTSFKKLNGTIYANPWTWLVAAIIAAAILIYIYWEPISEFFKELWKGIVEVCLLVWESLKQVWNNAVESLKEAWSTITEFFSDLWNAVVEVVMTILEPYIEAIINIWNHISEGITEIFEGVTQYFQAVWEIIKNIFLGAILLLINLVTGNFEELKENALAIWQNIKGALGQAWDAIKQIFFGALDVIKGYFIAAWENMKNFTTQLWEGLKTFFQTLWNSIKTFFIQALIAIWNNIKQKFTDMVNSIREKMTDAKDRIQSSWNDAKDFLAKIDLMQIGKDAIQGFINGIKEKVTDVANAAREAADAVTNKIKSILRIASPSKLLAQFGVWTGEGFAGGLLSMVRTVTSAADKLSLAAIPDIEPMDIAGHIQSAHSQANSNLSSRMTNELNVTTKQPAKIHLSIGGSVFEAFVEDITEVQDRMTNMREAFK